MIAIVDALRAFMNRSVHRKIDRQKKHESVRDYSNEELYEVLEKNEITDVRILAVICAEVLRRQKERNDKD
jgi:hypothetical protein